MVHQTNIGPKVGNPTISHLAFQADGCLQMRHKALATGAMLARYVSFVASMLVIILQNSPLRPQLASSKISKFGPTHIKSKLKAKSKRPQVSVQISREVPRNQMLQLLQKSQKTSKNTSLRRTTRRPRGGRGHRCDCQR